MTIWKRITSATPKWAKRLQRRLIVSAGTLGTVAAIPAVPERISTWCGSAAAVLVMVAAGLQLLVDDAAEAPPPPNT